MWLNAVFTILRLADNACLLHSYCSAFSFQQPANYSQTQATELEESLLYRGPVDPANWVGLEKSADLLGYLRVSRGELLQRIHVVTAREEQFIQPLAFQKWNLLQNSGKYLILFSVAPDTNTGNGVKQLAGLQKQLLIN